MGKVGYSPEILVATFEAIKKVLDTRAANVSGYELSGTYLANYTGFENLINAFKYALLESTFISGPQISRILASLRSIEYKDIELARLVMKKIGSPDFTKNSLSSYAKDFESMEELASLPFSGKENFSPGLRVLDETTISDSLERYIDAIEHLESHDYNFNETEGE